MVNTFIPFSSFKKIARTLDNKRLGKQRVEAMQILNIITGQSKTKAWQNHPAVKQWTGHTTALKAYINEMIAEWIRRGYKNTMTIYKLPKKWEMPWFVKNKTINTTHQASLLRKLPAHYSKYFKVPARYMKYSYIWAGDLTEEQINRLQKNNVDLSEFCKVI